jgi:hypothetical protein
MNPRSRGTRPPLRALLAFAHLAASLALLANTGCTTGTHAPVALPPRPLPDGTVPDDLELMPTALLKSIPLNAYVRVQAAPGRPGVPYFGGMAKSWRSDDVATLKYNDHFRKASSAFLKQIFPNSTEDARSPAGSAAQLRVEVKLSKTSYNREAQELHQYVTLRILGMQGTVLFQTVASTTVIGDVLADNAVIYRALEENFRNLAQKIAGAQAQILASIEFQREEFGVIQQILLAQAGRLGRSRAQNSTVNGQQYAVIIGISDYQAPGLRDLMSPAKDARDVFETLNDPANTFNFQDDNVVLLLDEAATLRNIRTALSRWLIKRVGKDDTVLIYFAGHGVYDQDLATGAATKKEKYFLPVDYNPEDDTYSSGLPMDEITEYFDRVAGKSVVMIFDACHAGAASLDDRTDELRRFSRVQSRQRTNVILAAAEANQISWERGDNGLFTYFLVNGLHGAADENGNGEVTATEIGAYVAREVPVASWQRYRSIQQPVLKVNDRTRAARFSIAAFR